MMRLVNGLTSLAVISAANAAISWGPCNDLTVVAPFTVDCGSLEVPLDYTDNSSTETVALSLARLPAMKKPSKGSIQINFGGPGSPSRPSLTALAATLMGLTGGHHDLVVFDQRGTGNTLPFSFYDDFGKVQHYFSSMVLANHSEVASGMLWTRTGADGMMALKNAPKEASLIGTAFLVRDMMSVVDALEEDGMLRYWGLSYGTTVGATAAAMFPDRIDKMVLDGVQNPHEYYHDTVDFEEWTDSDKVFYGIFETCLDHPAGCALAEDSVTADELVQKYWDLLEQVKYAPIAVNGFLLDYSTLKTLVAFNLYTVRGWPLLAASLKGLFNNEVTPALEILVSAFLPLDLDGAVSEALFIAVLEGVHCSDRTVRVETLEEFTPSIDKLYNISRTMGDVAVSLAMACAQWPIEAKERYQGTFNVETANPVLIVGNHFDSHTPLVSAYNLSSTLEGSRVLEIAGYGHCSVSVPSRCAVEKLSTYWNEGTMPENGFVCESSAPPYSGLWWPDVLDGSNSTSNRPGIKRDTMLYEPGYGFMPGRRW